MQTIVVVVQIQTHRQRPHYFQTFQLVSSFDDSLELKNLEGNTLLYTAYTDTLTLVFRLPICSAKASQNFLALRIESILSNERVAKERVIKESNIQYSCSGGIILSNIHYF